MIREVIPNYKTKMGGIPIEVPNAEISRCSNCGETSVSAKELKRWELIQKEQLRSTGQIPSPEEVTEIRTLLGLSISDFAKLLGVTRQTIHAWERPELAALQLGPAALLLKLLIDEKAGKTKGVFDYLLKQAAARGQEVTCPADCGHIRFRHDVRNEENLRVQRIFKLTPCLN
jgi:DNA-binding transcriptional regulator YiaG